MKIKNVLAALLPLAVMGDSMMLNDFGSGVTSGRVGSRKTQLSNKAWNKRKKRIANEKHARAKNRN